jgi:hypothetical protein
VTQAGRTTVYALHDAHIGALLDEALRHIEHLAPVTPEATRPPAGNSEPDPGNKEEENVHD